MSEKEEGEGSAPWTYATAPADKKYKWDFYFRDAPKYVRENIQMDEEGTYSVTDMVSAKRTTMLIRDKMREVLGIAGHDGSILDGSACIGGNTISFAQYFQRVTAVELSQNRCKMLAHNLDLFHLRQKVDIIEGEFTRAVASLPKFDVIFLDPPWGGEGYRENVVLDISFGGQTLVDVCNNLIGKASIIALKLPTNFNIVPFREKLDSRCRILVENTKIRKTLIILIAMPGIGAPVQVHPVHESSESPSKFSLGSPINISASIQPLLQDNTSKRATGAAKALQAAAWQSNQANQLPKGGIETNSYSNNFNNRKRTSTEALQVLGESRNEDVAKRSKQDADAAKEKDKKPFPDHL